MLWFYYSNFFEGLDIEWSLNGSFCDKVSWSSHIQIDNKKPKCHEVSDMYWNVFLDTHPCIQIVQTNFRMGE